MTIQEHEWIVCLAVAVFVFAAAFVIYGLVSPVPPPVDGAGVHGEELEHDLYRD